MFRHYLLFTYMNNAYHFYSPDPGPPTLLYRRVLLGFRLDRGEANRLADALERTELTMMLKPAFAIRTQIEHAGEPLA